MQNRHMCTFLQLVLSVDDDLLVGREAGVYKRLPLADLSDLDWAGRHGGVGIDNIGVGSLLALLHHRCGNGQAVMPRIDQEPYADELARPQPMGRIWKLCLEPYRTGGLQDLIVDKRELALIELDLPVLAVRQKP